MDNGMMRKIFGCICIRDTVTASWREFHSEELRNLYSLPYIIRVIKSKSIGMACSIDVRDGDT
jgi:hypothetical protein